MPESVNAADVFCPERVAFFLTDDFKARCDFDEGEIKVGEVRSEPPQHGLRSALGGAVWSRVFKTVSARLAHRGGFYGFFSLDFGDPAKSGC